MKPDLESFEKLNVAITQCERCPRLREHCLKIATVKKRAFKNDTYWGRPVPPLWLGIQKPKTPTWPKLIIIGLAPSAHGANRTGRMFTGDASGLWLYRALNEFNLYNTAYITTFVKCAPPDNKPNLTETTNCRDYFGQELSTMLPLARAVLCFGHEAYKQFLFVAKSHLALPDPKLPFKHGHEINASHKKIFLSYHPSQHSTATKKLTKPMFDSVFSNIQSYLEGV